MCGPRTSQARSWNWRLPGARWWGSRGESSSQERLRISNRVCLLVAHAGHTQGHAPRLLGLLVSLSSVFFVSVGSFCPLSIPPRTPPLSQEGRSTQGTHFPAFPRQRRLSSSASTRTPDSTRHHEPPAACPSAPPSRPTGSLLLRLGHGKQPPRMRALLCCQHGPTTQGQHPRDPVKPG